MTPSSVHNSHCHTQGILGKDIEFLSFYSLLFPGLMLQNATNIHISAIKSIQSILVVTLFKCEVVDSKHIGHLFKVVELKAALLELSDGEVSFELDSKVACDAHSPSVAADNCQKRCGIST